MKTIQVSAVTEMVRQAVQKINFDTPANTLLRLKEVQISEFFSRRSPGYDRYCR